MAQRGETKEDKVRDLSVVRLQSLVAVSVRPARAPDSTQTLTTSLADNMLGLTKEEVGKRLGHLAHVVKETTIYLATLSFSLMAIFR